MPHTVSGAAHVPKYLPYLALISSDALSCSIGSVVSTLICESGTRSAGSTISGWKERRYHLSTSSCWPSRENKKLMNSRAALGCGASFMMPLPPANQRRALAGIDNCHRRALRFCKECDVLGAIKHHWPLT